MSTDEHTDTERYEYYLFHFSMLHKARKLAMMLKASDIVQTEREVIAEIEHIQSRYGLRVVYLDGSKVDLTPVLGGAGTFARYTGRCDSSLYPAGHLSLWIERASGGCKVSINSGFAQQTVEDPGCWPASRFERIRPPWIMIDRRGEPALEMIVLWHELGHHICFQSQHEVNGVHSDEAIAVERCAVACSFRCARTAIQSNKLSPKIKSIKDA